MLCICVYTDTYIYIYITHSITIFYRFLLFSVLSLQYFVGFTNTCSSSSVFLMLFALSIAGN
jgi:hypothetical protein